MVALLLASMFTLQPIETAEARDARMGWWREAKFGMFIHWGLYAVPAGRWNDREVGGAGEWILNSGQITVADYEPLQSRFNPVGFDADAWAKLAADAGMKYIIITSKHHDGFCLWDSAQTDWDVMGTPFGRDILLELAEACKRRGIRLGFYHSIMDWHHPDYSVRRSWDPRPELGQPNMDRYVEYMKAQLGELLSGRYGDVPVLWFDGEWEEAWTHERGKDLHDHLMQLKPDLIVNNRIDKGRGGMAGMTSGDQYRGDFGTPEQEIPARGFPGVDWESCMTMNDTWGYKLSDDNWKSTSQLIYNLVDIASKGGNFLLNVGPKADGTIPAASVERLQAIGEWLNVNGEAIYGTQPSPFNRSPFKATRKGNKLFLHVFDWPTGPLAVPGLKNKVNKAYLLANPGTPLGASRSGDQWLVRLPAKAPDSICSVLVLEVEGEPVVETVPLLARPDGLLELNAFDAITTGGIRFEQDKRCLGFWTNADDRVSWDVRVPRDGRFRVQVWLACPQDTAGSIFEVRVGDQSLEGLVTPTGSWSEFERVDVGTLDLKKGDVQVEIRAKQMKAGAVMNLRQVRLQPE